MHCSSTVKNINGCIVILQNIYVAHAAGNPVFFTQLIKNRITFK
jgi:hypothetical protein